MTGKSEVQDARPLFGGGGGLWGVQVTQGNGKSWGEEVLSE